MFYIPHSTVFYFLLEVRFPWRGELVYLRRAWRSNSLVHFIPHPGVCRPFELLDLLVEEEMQFSTADRRSVS